MAIDEFKEMNLLPLETPVLKVSRPVAVRLTLTKSLIALLTVSRLVADVEMPKSSAMANYRRAHHARRAGEPPNARVRTTSLREARSAAMFRL